MKKQIVILGAGFAGLHTFYKLRHLIGKKAEITLIDSRTHSLLKPSLPEVAFEGAPLAHSLVEIAHTIEARGGRFLHDEVTEVDAKKSALTLANGEPLSYDYLLIAVGARKDYDAVTGYEEYGYSVCDDREAQRLWERVQHFEEGNIVTGAAKSTWGDRVDAPPLLAPCEGPIGEVMFMLDHYLTAEKGKKRGEDFRIDVFTPGAIFFEDVGDIPRKVVGEKMQERNMQLHTAKVLREIGKDFVVFEDGTRMPSDLTIVIPPYAAPQFLRKSSIGDNKGFVPTDKEMRHLDFDNIFAAGDINALAQPKLGHIAILQAAIAAAVIARELGESIEIPLFEPEVFCIMNMGGHEATLIVSDVLYGGKTDKAFCSPLAKMMKWGFDSYLYYNKGHMPPDFALEAMDRLLKL